MVIPVPGTIPDSTLSPAQVRQKFAVQSLGGLGDSTCGDGTCTELADDGSCNYCDYSNATSTTTLQIPGQVTTPPFFSQMGIAPPASGASTTGSYMSQGGNIITTFSDGTFLMTSPGTGSTSRGYGTPPPGQAGTVTAAQASVWPSLINALTQAGVRLGTVSMLRPGQSMTPNGTIVGSGQSLIGPGGTGINIGSFSTLFSNPMFLIGGFGILALLVLSGGKR